MGGLFSIGVSGLQSASVNLATVAHNTTNSDTAGYTRQRAVQATNIAVLTGSGYIGQGSHVATVARLYDSFLTRQVNSAQTSASGIGSYYTELAKIDNMLADANSGLSTALQDFFTGVNDVSANPAQPSSRQSMVSSAQSLASRYQSINGQLNELYDGVNSQMASTVSSINTYAKQIATLNDQIVFAQSAANQPPNDLLDQRDQVIAELNKLVGVTTTTDANGSYNVFIGTGQQLVVGTQVTTLEAKPSSADVSRYTIYLKSSGGSQELPESLLTGGSLSGLLAFRSESLDKTSNELGRNAASLALTFNAQHALGQDARGAAKGESGFVADFFTTPKGRVLPNSLNAASSPLVSISLTPARADATDGHFYTDLTASDYRLGYDGTDLTLTRLSDNKTWTAAGSTNIADINAQLALDTADPQGFTLSSATAFTAGSAASYVIQPTRSAASEIAVNPAVAADTNRIAAALPVRTAVGSTNTGKAAISAGNVDATFSTAATVLPVTLAYDSATNSFSGFPAVAVTVNNGGTSTTYPAGTPVPYTSGATISFSGISLQISGTANNNDSFTISRNSSGSSDGRNALALGKLLTQKTISGATATYQSDYASLVSDVGNKTRELKSTGDAQQSLLEQASDARSSLSGVNLDEEAADLMRYQEAYNACAKVIEIASKLFETILAIN